MKWKSLFIAVLLTIGMSFAQKAEAGPKPAAAKINFPYMNCSIKVVGTRTMKPPNKFATTMDGDLWARVSAWFYDCDNYAGSFMGWSTNRPMNALMHSAAINDRQVQVTLGEQYGIDTFTVSVFRVRTAVELNGLKHGENCKVHKADTTVRFQRCSLTKCKIASEDSEYPVESDSIFNMCMTALTTGKRVKISYVEKDGKKIITYMRMEVPK